MYLSHVSYSNTCEYCGTYNNNTALVSIDGIVIWSLPWDDQAWTEVWTTLCYSLNVECLFQNIKRAPTLLMCMSEVWQLLTMCVLDCSYNVFRCVYMQVVLVVSSLDLFFIPPGMLIAISSIFGDGSKPPNYYIVYELISFGWTSIGSSSCKERVTKVNHIYIYTYVNIIINYIYSIV